MISSTDGKAVISKVNGILYYGERIKVHRKKTEIEYEHL